MPRKEGPFAHGEKLSRPAEHRADGLDRIGERLNRLVRQFGPDVVDDPVYADELRQKVLRERLAATAHYEITPEGLRSDRQRVYAVTDEPTEPAYERGQATPFTPPLSKVIDMPESQPPAQPPMQSMYEPWGGPQ